MKAGQMLAVMSPPTCVSGISYSTQLGQAVATTPSWSRKIAPGKIRVAGGILPTARDGVSRQAWAIASSRYEIAADEVGGRHHMPHWRASISYMRVRDD